MSIDELTAEALQLDAVSRAKLARTLLSSLDELSEAEIESLWLEEALRRDGELERGAVKPVPMESVIAELRDLSK